MYLVISKFISNLTWIIQIFWFHFQNTLGTVTGSHTLQGQQQAASVANVGNVVTTTNLGQATVTTPQQSLLIVSNVIVI